MFIRSALFFVLFFALCLPVGASDFVVLQVEVLPGFSVQLPAAITLTAAPPGQIVQDATEIQIRANVPWHLQVSGAQWSGSMGEVGLESNVDVRTNDNEWSPPSAVSPRTVAAGDPTGDTWHNQSIDFRFTTSFSDPPGSYQMTLEFEVIPQL